MSLKSVKTPKAFEPLFIKAHEFVRRYFKSRKEDPTHGTIEIGGQRYIFVRASSMSVEFFDMVKNAYRDRPEDEAIAIARNLLFDIAHAIGAADAREFHRRMKVKDPIAKLSAGPIHFAYSGWAFVDIHPESRPTPDENYFLVYDHPYSFESDSWKRAKRRVDFPVCVMNAGYSSGWCQESFGVELVATEITCKARGDRHCRFIMAHPSKIESYLENYQKTKNVTAPKIDHYSIPGFFSRKTAEAELRKILGEIDARVAARTAPLELANAQLRKEIEERIKSETALAQSEEKYRKLIDTAKDAIFVADAKTGMIMAVNRQAEMLTGRSSDELMNMHQSQLHPPGEESRYSKIFQDFFKTGELPAEDMYVWHSSGRKIPIDISASICEIGGRTIIQGVFRDVTATRQIIQALRESDDRYKTFMEHSSEGIYRLEVDPPIPLSADLDERVRLHFKRGFIAECNAVLVRMYGFEKKDDLIGKRLDELLVPTDPHNVEYLKDFHRTYRFNDQESHEVDREGRPKYFLNSAIGIIEHDHLVRVWGTQRDITDRKLTELALRQSESRFRTLVESMRDMVIITDYDHHVLFVNEGALRMTGFTKTEMFDRSGAFPHVHPEDRDEVVRTIETFKTSSRIHSPAFENRYIRKDGSVRWHSSVISKAELDGKPTLQYLVRDVTEWKHAQIEIENNRANLRAIIDNTRDMIWSIDAQLEIVSVNETFRKAIQRAYRVHLAPGVKVMESVPDDRKPLWLERYRRVLDGENFKVVDRIEWDGRTYDYEISFNPIRAAAGSVTGAAFFARDITEQLRARDALQAEKEKLTVTLRSIGDGVITTDPDGKIQFLNREAERLTGWTQSQCEGRDIEEVLRLVDEHSRTVLENPVKRVIASGGIVEIGDFTVLVRKDGTEILISDSGAPIRDPQSRLIGVVIVFRDISEKRRVEEERVKRMKLESVGVLAGGIAHDFNNLLTAILGNLSLAKMDLEQGNISRLSDILARSEKASLRAKDLTQQLLTFSRGGAPVRKIGPIASLIREAVEFVSHGSRNKTEYDIFQDLWAVDADQGQIIQVIHNLVINAMQAMPDGGTLRISAVNRRIDAHASLATGDYVAVTIADTGPGIPKSIQQKIFDPYFTTKEIGSGLGLATCYSIIKNHQGLIEVDSEPGRGAAFTFYLPAVVTYREEKIGKDAALHGGRGRVLIMDDEAEIRSVIGRLLHRLGYEAVTVADGQEAYNVYVEALENGARFDAVIMDLTVPGGIGGRDATKMILSADPGARIVVSSGYSNDPIVANYASYGFKGVLGKPYRIDELQAVLADLLSKG
jgi:PAS domain S-box-containing protein